METKTGTIRTITESQGQSNKGPWKRFSFEFKNGDTYSSFDEKIGTSFKPGQSVVMTGEQKGKFWNMNTMALREDKSEPKEEATDLTEPTALILECLYKTNDLLQQILSVLKMEE